MGSGSEGKRERREAMAAWIGIRFHHRCLNAPDALGSALVLALRSIKRTKRLLINALVNIL